MKGEQMSRRARLLCGAGTLAGNLTPFLLNPRSLPDHRFTLRQQPRYTEQPQRCNEDASLFPFVP